jgi:hypothetical protein
MNALPPILEVSVTMVAAASGFIPVQYNKELS